MNPNNNQNQTPQPKPNLTPNYTYGVDTNDKNAVRAEYIRLKRQHRIITFLSIIAIGVLLFFVFDFVRVNMMDQKPILAIKTRVDSGNLYKGVGYKILYCDDGEVYKAVIDDNKCNTIDNSTFEQVFYNALLDYLKTNKLLDELNVIKFDIVNKVLDENFDDGSSDYLVDINYTCIDGGSYCFKTLKEQDDQNNIRLFVSIDSGNKVTDVVTFKNSGLYYEEIRKDYEEKVKNYKLQNDFITEDNLRMFTVKLINNYGRYKYKGTVYNDAYLVSIDYMCFDNTNTCVRGEDVDNENLYLEEIMLLDENNEILLMKNPRIMNN